MKTNLILGVETERGDNSPFCTAFCYMADGKERLVQGRWGSVRRLIRSKFGACLVHFLLKRFDGIKTTNSSLWEIIGRNITIYSPEKNFDLGGIVLRRGRYNIVSRSGATRFLIASFRKMPKKWLEIYDKSYPTTEIVPPGTLDALVKCLNAMGTIEKISECVHFPAGSLPPSWEEAKKLAKDVIHKAGENNAHV